MPEEKIEIGNESSHVREPEADYGKRWGGQIRYTWALALLLCVVPAVVYGAAFPAGFVFIFVVVLGIPTGLVALLVIDKSRSGRLWRRLVVLGSIAVSTFVVVSQTDKLTPSMATPIAQAIEQYKNDNGNYPATLADLSPKYLADLPSVRAAIRQPTINYVVRGGRPRLVIPSAVGDAFASYEYNFKTKSWVHNS